MQKVPLLTNKPTSNGYNGVHIKKSKNTKPLKWQLNVRNLHFPEGGGCDHHPQLFKWW